MKANVKIVRDREKTGWIIRDGSGGALLFGGLAFPTERAALLFIDSANRKVGGKRWLAKKNQSDKARQLSLF